MRDDWPVCDLFPSSPNSSASEEKKTSEKERGKWQGIDNVRTWPAWGGFRSTTDSPSKSRISLWFVRHSKTFPWISDKPNLLTNPSWIAWLFKLPNCLIPSSRHNLQALSTYESVALVPPGHLQGFLKSPLPIQANPSQSANLPPSLVRSQYHAADSTTTPRMKESKSCSTNIKTDRDTSIIWLSSPYLNFILFSVFPSFFFSPLPFHPITT